MKRFLSFSLVIMMAAIMVLPCFAYTGTGTVNDPIVADGTVAMIPDVSLPLYYTVTGNASPWGFHSSSVTFKANTTYYIYTDKKPNSFRLYAFSSSSEDNELFQVNTTKIREDDRYIVYSFTPSSDGYGLRVNSTHDQTITYIFSDTLYDSASVTQWAVALAGTTFQVGSSMLQLVTSHWIVMLSVILMVAVGSFGFIRKLIKGV